MISVDMITPQEMQTIIAQQVRTLRLALNLSQQTLSEKTGVSYGTLKKFEQTGQISLSALLKLAVVLGKMDNFKQLFVPSPTTTALSLDDLINEHTRKRGRQ
jgi:transcriptional regulator with XRE-family HTH domain